MDDIIFHPKPIHKETPIGLIIELGTRRIGHMHHIYGWQPKTGELLHAWVSKSPNAYSSGQHAIPPEQWTAQLQERIEKLINY